MFPAASTSLKRPSVPVGSSTSSAPTKRPHHNRPEVEENRGENDALNDLVNTSGPILSTRPAAKTCVDAQSQTEEPAADTLLALLTDMAVDAARIDDFLQKVNAPRAQADFNGDSDENEGAGDLLDQRNFEPRDSVAAASPKMSITAGSVVKLLDGVAALRAKMARIDKTLDQFDRISSEITVVNASGDAAFSGQQFLLTYTPQCSCSSVDTTILPKAKNTVAASTPIVCDVIDMVSDRLYDTVQETAKLADDARQKSLHDQARELAAASFVYEPRDEGGVELPPWLFAGLTCDFVDSASGSEQGRGRTVELKRVSRCADRPPRVLAKSPVIVTRSQERNRAAGGPPVLERRRGMCYLMWKGLEDTSGERQVGTCPEYDTLSDAIEMLVYLECGDGDNCAGAAEKGVWATCDFWDGRRQCLHPATKYENEEAGDDIVRERHAVAGAGTSSLFQYYPIHDYDDHDDPVTIWKDFCENALVDCRGRLRLRPVYLAGNCLLLSEPS